MLKTDEAVRLSEDKRIKNQEKENEGKEKGKHGQYVRDKAGVVWTWQWIGKGDLKGCTESLIFSLEKKLCGLTRFHVNKIRRCVECVEKKKRAEY